MKTCRSLVLLAVLVPASVVWGAAVRTPQLTEGPFYPFNSSNSLPALTERDADLTKLKEGKSAAGKTLLLSGVLRDLEGKPISGASVEIWQTDDGGIYYHSGNRTAGRDEGFQYFGECATDSEGRYDPAPTQRARRRCWRRRISASIRRPSRRRSATGAPVVRAAPVRRSESVRKPRGSPTPTCH
ncbi:MAG: hypothetical protein V4773_24845 [Verrucomicrobiota bacterium]